MVKQQSRRVGGPADSSGREPLRSVSIRTRIVLAMALVGVAAFGSMIVALNADYHTQVDRAANDALLNSRLAFSALIEHDTEKLTAVLETVMSRDDLRQALAARDKRRLLELSNPLYAELERRYGVTHLYFIAPDGRVVLRTHRPSQSGDLIAQTTFTEAQRTETFGAGLELGLTAYALRVVHPVTLTDGTPDSSHPSTEPVVGYIEVAEDVGPFLQELKQQDGGDFGLLLDKKSLNRKAWAKMRSENSQPDDWDDRSAQVLAVSTNVSLSDRMRYPGALSSLPSEGRVLGVTTQNGLTKATCVYPVSDAAGKSSGAIVVIHDLSPVTAQLRDRELRTAAIMLISGAALLMAVLLLVNRLVFARLYAMDAHIGPSSPGVMPFPIEGDDGIGRDEIGQFEQELAQSRRGLELQSALLNNASESFLALDERGTIVYVNEAACVSRGYAPDELLGMSAGILVSDAYRAAVPTFIKGILSTGHGRFESEHKTKGGRVFPVEIHAKSISTAGRNVIAAEVRDLSERKESEATIKRLAYYDSLTGLANRRLLDDRIAMALAHAARADSSLAVVFVDVDGLKTINDSMGHPAGDRVLKEAARRLSQIVREEDTVSRMGGDEFVILVTDVGPEEAQEFAERVAGVFAPPMFIAGKRISVTASVGIAVREEGDSTSDSLIRRADAAMYAVKQSGGHGHRVFQPQMTATSDATRFALRTEIRDSFDKGQFSLRYQPQVRLEDGVISGVEALLRWEHPTKGNIPPGEFIAVAEEAGLIVPIGTWVIDTACRQAMRWRDSGLDIRMNVNVSAWQFLHGDLVGIVASCLASSGLPAERLELEITEGTALSDSADVQKSLDGLKELGVRIAIDDFGIGYSSLGIIDRMSVHSLKIDKLFVSQMVARPQSRAIVGTIIGLARFLNLLVVAEGVESVDQLAALGELDCAEAQGYLLSRAVTPDEIARLATEVVDLRPS